MSIEMDRIKKALTMLNSDSERREIKTFIDEFNIKNLQEQKISKADWGFKNLSVGPTSSAICAFCGK